MSKASRPTTQKAEINSSAKTKESGTKVLAKSDWPKTPKGIIKLILSTFLNFFG